VIAGLVIFLAGMLCGFVCGAALIAAITIPPPW